MIKRASDFAFGSSALPSANGDNEMEERGRKKKKRSRWATSEEEKIVIPGMPTVIPANMSKEQEEQYLLQLQIEEISRRLRTGDLGIPHNPEDRSPSPEPIYNNEGKRLNTREYRTRKKLEEQRHQLIQKQMEMNEEYKPPTDYKPPVTKITDKVMIPQDDHPDINFVGLLIGPRGNTLKNLEKDTGAKIIIRGKGSVKEGKIGRKDGMPMPGEDEPLHAYITATNPDNVAKATAKIKEIIQQGIEVPEQQNDLRRQQLRELALLNGTLRENDGLMKLKQLQEAQTIITNQIFCHKCGGTGHIASDCKQARPSETLRDTERDNDRERERPVSRAERMKMDSEYSALMAELGEGPPSSGGGGGGGRSRYGDRDRFNDRPRDQAFGQRNDDRFRGGDRQRFPDNRSFSSSSGRPMLQLPPPQFSQAPASSVQSNSVRQGPTIMAQPTVTSRPPPLMGIQQQQLKTIPPPWLQQQRSTSAPQYSHSNPIQSAPIIGMSSTSSLPGPPPPPTSQPVPWQQPQSTFPMPPVPPAPWQHQQQTTVSAAPQHMSAPPGPPTGMPPPWQQPQQQQVVTSMAPPSHMMPPPPPPGQMYGGHAPPPPPGQAQPGTQLGMPPPPPPT